MFEPQTHLERLLAHAHLRPTDAKAYARFVKELMSTTLGALGKGAAHGFQPLEVSPAGTRGVCVFTHPARYDAFCAELMLPAADWQVRPERARPLFGWALTNELFVLLNPGSDYGKDFPPIELDRLLRGQWL